MQKIRIYWITQLTGWFIYFTLNFFFFSFKNYSSVRDVVFHLLLVPAAILLTHTFRYFIIIKKWLQKPILIQIGIVLVASLLLSLAFFFIQYILNSSSIILTYISLSFHHEQAYHCPMLSLSFPNY